MKCRCLKTAKTLLNLCLDIGLKNSGIITSNKKNYMVAIRSTLKMEMPLAYSCLRNEIHLVINQAFINELVRMINEKFKTNFETIEKLYQKINNHFMPYVYNFILSLFSMGPISGLICYTESIDFIFHIFG